MIALVFLYWIATIFVYGGELNAEILRARERKQAAEEAARAANAERDALKRAPLFQKTMRWLGYEKRKT
jgi:membrane protein